MKPYRFLITGKIVPYTRMTQKSKYVNPRHKAYLASQDTIKLQLKQQMNEQGYDFLPEQTPLKMSYLFRGYGHNCDGSNLEKAIEDACQGVVFKNDCWVDVGKWARIPGGFPEITVLVEVLKWHHEK